MGALKGPPQYSFILGVLGGVPPTTETLSHMAAQPAARATPGR